MRFFANDPFHLVKATWYRCKPGAKVFPTWHTFTSENWDYSHPSFFPLGDDAFSKRVWYNGRRLNSSDGTTFAGPLEFFQTGAPAPGLLPRSNDGTPVVCLRAPFGTIASGLCVPVRGNRGSTRGGGFFATTVTPGLPCLNCVGTTPASPVITVAGAFGFAAPLNGTWTLIQITPCQWQRIVAPGVVITMARAVGNQWLPTLGIAFNPSGFYSSITSDCVTDNNPTLTAGPPQYPPSIAMTFL